MTSSAIEIRSRQNFGKSEIQNCHIHGTDAREGPIILADDHGHLRLENLYIADISFNKWTVYTKAKIAALFLRKKYRVKHCFEWAR